MQIQQYISLSLSIVSGLIIGYERKRSGHKEAESRTLALICLGCCLFTIIPTVSNTITDIWRMPAAIIQGIGFLASGVILKEGISVKGLTTSAGIWVAAAIGICYGCQEYILGIITTVLVYIILTINKIYDKKQI